MNAENLVKFEVVDKPLDAGLSGDISEKRKMYNDILSSLSAIESTKAVQISMSDFKSHNVCYLRELAKKRGMKPIRVTKKNGKYCIWINK